MIPADIFAAAAILFLAGVVFVGLWCDRSGQRWMHETGGVRRQRKLPPVPPRPAAATRETVEARHRRPSDAGGRHRVLA